MKNTGEKLEGGITGKGFDVSGQPTPEAKREGWRKRQMLFYWIRRYSRMSVEDFDKLQRDIQRNKANYSMFQYQAIQYVIKSGNGDHRFLFDWLDRTHGKVLKNKISGGLKTTPEAPLTDEQKRYIENLLGGSKSKKRSK